MTFEDLFKGVNESVNPFWDQTQKEAFLKFTKVLAENPVIRMWVDGKPGYGHQSSTVAVLRQFAAEPQQFGFGYRGTVEVYYDPEHKTEAKLQELLPELKGGTSCTINNTSVKVIPFTKAPSESVMFGFTGGADNITWPWPIEVNFARKLNTELFLRLQPYLWSHPEQIQYGDKKKKSILLTQEKCLGEESFNQRAFYLPPVSQPNWSIYDGTPNEKIAKIVRLVTESQDWALCPIYGIRSTSDMQLEWPPADRLFDVIASALASQYTPDGKPALNARSVVALLCDTVDEPQIDYLAQLLQGEPEYFFEQPQIDELDTLKAAQVSGTSEPYDQRSIDRLEKELEAYSRRKGWLAKVDTTNRVEAVSGVDPDEIAEALKWASDTKDRVLLIRLGRVPPPLFTWCMQQSGWPSVFEGLNTASVALNIGKLYFHVAREDLFPVQYPTSILNYDTSGDQRDNRLNYFPVSYTPSLPRKIQIAANQINRSPALWDQPGPDNLAEIAGGLVCEYNAEQSDTEPLHAYFTTVRDFYRQGINGKLHVGVAFLQYVLNGRADTQARALGDTPPVMETLLKTLEANISEGVLRVVPGAFNEGGIHDLYSRLLGRDPGLVVAKPSVTPHYEESELTSILVEGEASLMGLEMRARITFTAPYGVIVADARYVHDQDWSIPQIPWLGFASPFVELSIADDGTLPTGAVGGQLRGADLGVELAFRLPVAAGYWQLAGSFQAPYPSIAQFFRMAGGIDLVRALPKPVSELAGFGLRNVSMVYDVTAAQVQNVGFRIGTAEGFDLFSGLRAEDVSVDVVVQRPDSMSDRSTDWIVSCVLSLGERPDAGVIGLSAGGPGLKLTGSLISGTITVGDLIDVFAPDVTLDLPDLPSITAFSCSFAPEDNSYTASCQLNVGWPVTVQGRTIFTIEGLGFAVQRNALMLLASLNGTVSVGADLEVLLNLTALYESTSGWTFRVGQSPDSVISLSALANQFLPESWQIGQDYGIADLTMTAAVSQGTWSVGGRTAQPWRVPFLPGLAVNANLMLGYKNAPAGYRARLETDWTWQGVDLKVFFDYQPDKQQYGIQWGLLEGLVEGPSPEGDWTATLRFGKNITVGGIIETMVSWATGAAFSLEAPWSVLNAIPLSGLALTWVFNSKDKTRQKIAFAVDIGPISLGFARIDKISVAYNSQARERVAVTLIGSFPWNVGTDAMGDTSSLGPWDASRPGTAPAPPGTGGKYLDLRLLALGQHVTAPGLASAASVEAAIKALEGLKDPEPGKIPEIAFDAQSSWIIGGDLGILRFGDDKAAGEAADRPADPAVPVPPKSGYLITAQAVFNDPRLYGLRLALAGDAAKVFKGLDFQILYRQVSDTVGVYQAEIALPDAMRYLSIGAYSITLPVFGIAVYTNGDFLIDIGFPWNEDFSRSFTIEGIVYPGIPLVGSAGFYLGKLSSATSDHVPKVLDGVFNPVLVFGLGMQVGFGKSIEYGPLRAGFGLTAVGILEGVLARFSPYQPSAVADRDPAQVQDSYYFRLRGTLGIVGRLYGSVDFAVVKATVDVTVKLLLQLTYESYVSMAISVIVSVDVSASIKIDLGLFSISLSFSFSMRLKETFTIENIGVAPWHTVTGPSGALSGPADRRLGHRAAPSPAALTALASADRWRRLLPAETGVKALTGWLSAGLTVAHDEWDEASDPARQLPCHVLLPLIETVPDAEGTAEDLIAATAQAPETSFELLAAMTLRWAVAALQTEDKTPEAVDALVVSAADLGHLLETVLVSRDDAPMPLTADDVDTFLTRQFKLTLSVPDSTVEGRASATAFPMPPALTLTAPSYGEYAGCNYRFADYNALDDAAIRNLRDYFDRLAVGMGGDRPAAERLSSAGPLSMASWVQSDYFLLLTRQMVQIALDSLRDFKYELDGSDLHTIAGRVNENGKLVGDERVNAANLIAANPSHPFTAGRTLTIGALSTTAPEVKASFTSIAADVPGDVSAASLAALNAADERLLSTGAQICYQDTVYTVRDGDSLITVARHVGARFGAFLGGATGLLTDTTLLVRPATVLLPLVTHRVQAGDSFEGIAALPVYRGGEGPPFTAAQLARQNAGRPVLRLGAEVGYRNQTNYRIAADDTLADVAAHFSVSLDDLFADSDVLRHERLFRDVADLVLPPFPHLTAEGETPTALAARYAAPMDVLGMPAANGLIAELFATRTSAGAPAPFIDVPHLPRYRVGEILAEARRTLAIRTLSRMAGRYALHGTRLPAEDIRPLAKGLWVHGTAPDLTLPAMAGLYALTGQQIEVPRVDARRGDFRVLLRRDAQPSWLTFAGGKDELAITIAPGSLDADRISAVLDLATSAPFDVGGDRLGAGAAYERHPVTYPLTVSTLWQSPAPVELPYGPPSGAVPALRLWSLPEPLVSLSDPAVPGKIAPRFAVRTATYDEATGGTVQAPIASYGWATVVEFAIKRVPALAGSPATADTYEITGADGAAALLLERMVREIGDDDTAYASLSIAFAPDPAGDTAQGLQTDAAEYVTAGISQVNLSTATHPPAAAGTELGAELLNSPSAFVRLLWEAGITRSGGFYLYYRDMLDGRGLPDRIFNDRGEARVTLIALYTAPRTPADQDRVRDYHTALVTGQSIDTTQTVVFAEAAPMEAPVPADPALSLGRLADLTYSDPADLAAANSTLRLAAGRRLTVRDGVFQAPPQGISLTEIVARFGISGVAALRAANPRWTGGLPDPLPYPAAIMLPTLVPTTGQSPHTATLADIADFYGVDLAALAADNLQIAGLFADGQQVTVTGGPTARTATVPPGVATVTAERAEPQEAPSAVTDDYARLLLKNNFSLLGYRIAGNVYFQESGLGMPAGPNPPTNRLDPSPDKIRVAVETDVWEYRQALPYSDFALVAAASPEGLPPAKGDPYVGVGFLLQVAFGWQDLYGNTLITTLDAPRPGSRPVNMAPQLLGYTDALTALSKWPAVASAWHVAAASQGGAPQLTVLLSFDPARYSGLIETQVTGPRSLLARFTDPLDPISAAEADRYRVDGAEIVSALPDAAGRTVTLTLDRPLDDGKHVLAASGLLGLATPGSAAPSYTGTAAFPVPEGPDGHTSSIAEAAARDLQTYTALYYQLTDANGVTAEISSTLLRESVGLDGQMWSGLLNWLFTAPNSIYQYLRERAAGHAGAAAPTPVHVIALPLADDELNPAQIYRLSVSFTLRRTGGAVLPALRTTAGIREATTVISPLTDRLDPATDSDTIGLRQFAVDFENALSVPGEYQLKVAGGVDRAAAASQRSGTDLWAVRVASTPGKPLSYLVTDSGAPKLFAPRPLSNRLQNRLGVPIRDYTTGVGLSPTPTRVLDFTDVDLDVWGRDLLGAVDAVLAPEFVSGMRIVTARTGGPDYLRRILDQKQLLADAISKLMIPLYADEDADPAAVREEFRQALLFRLSTAYSTRAAIQFTADVYAEPELAGQPPARLYGPVTDVAANPGQVSEIALSSPRLPLTPATAVPLPFLLSAPETVRRGGAVAGWLDLDLRWSADAIEHQVQYIGRYPASSWLRFLLPEKPNPLAGVLGEFPVPLVLRSFPTRPDVAEQKGEQDHPEAKDLRGITAWTYAFSWTLPIHYPQDKLYGEVEFNLAAPAAAFAVDDAVPALGQFVTVFPAVRADLAGILASIDADTTDPRTLADAAAALEAFIDLLALITGSLADDGTLDTAPVARQLIGAASLTFAFTVEEGSVEVSDPRDPRRTITALLVTVAGDAAQYAGIPVVHVGPEREYEPVQHEIDGDAVSYVYLDSRSNTYLTAAEGQKIPGRTLKLPGLDVRQRQDASARVWMRRNEHLVPNKPAIAEPFVYTTPEVAFPEPLLPTLRSIEPIPIAELGSGNGPKRRPLRQHLEALLTSLLDGTPSTIGDISIQVETVYAYRLNPRLDKITLPVFLQAPTEMAVPRSNSAHGTIPAQLAANWSDAITAWFSDPPNGAEGELRLDLTIMSTLTRSSMPVLRLHNLYLPLADIEPPLPTAEDGFSAAAP